MLLLEARADTLISVRDSEQKLQAEVRMHNQAAAAAQQTAERLEEQLKQDEHTKQLQEKHIKELTEQVVSILLTFIWHCHQIIRSSVISAESALTPTISSCKVGTVHYQPDAT